MKVLDQEIILDTKWLKLYKEKVQLSEDKIIPDFYTIQELNWVCCIVYCQGKILFLHQFRRGSNRIEMEVPAGIIENSESIQDAAIREVTEETGISFSSFECIDLGSLYPDPSRNIQTAYGILCKIDSYTTIQQELDSGEHVYGVEWLSMEEVKQMLRKGDKLQHASQLAFLYRALDHLQH